MEKTRPLLLCVAPNRILDSFRPMVEAIGANGYGTIVATTFDEAVAMADRRPSPDLIVLFEYDYGWDGVVLIERLKRSGQTAAIPILALSTNADHQIRDREPRARKAGATDFIQIPVRMEIILDSIQTILNPSASRSERVPR